MLKITERFATVQDCINAHKYEGAPWEGWRGNAKTSNFSLLFGCAPGRFAQTLRTSGFSEKNCEELIRDAGLSQLYNELKSKKPNDPDIDIKYLTCATFMRNGFFEGYKGLADRLSREWAYAQQNGFVRCWHGPVRHLPEMLLMRYKSNGQLAGLDSKIYNKYLSELKNIAGNSTIQTLEVRITFATIHYLCQTIKNWHFKSFMYSMCHDSEDWVIYDEEEAVVLALIKYAGEFVREPTNGVYMRVDFSLSDMSTEEKRESQYYHRGRGCVAGDIHEELEKYNKKHGTNLVLPPLEI